VDDAALKDADKTVGEWISYNLGWSEQRFSPLKQMDATNIKRLGLAWSSDIPSAQGRPQKRQEGTPLVSNGVM
jgi:quinohemoprotein ethanol dehydrogenase